MLYHDLRVADLSSSESFTMLLLNFTLFVAAIVTLFVPVACYPLLGRETNAQRMARGLPPSPPKFGRNLPGRALAINARGTPSEIPCPFFLLETHKDHEPGVSASPSPSARWSHPSASPMPSGVW